MAEDICSKIWTNPIKGKRKGAQKIGMEMEFHSYDSITMAPMGTTGSKLNPQMLLKRIVQITPGAKINIDPDTGLSIGVFLDSGGNFTVEPGGQIEYSSAPFEKMSDLIQNMTTGLQILEKAAEGDLFFLSHGTNPIGLTDHPLILPKQRYKVMTRYFDSAPHLRCLDMMRHTSSVQANIDIFGDENWQDAVHLVLALIPITTPLFANSRYFKGKKSHFVSERQEIWKHFDLTRAGIPDGLFFAENVECAYAQWAKKANVMLIDALPLEGQPLYNELSFGTWYQEGYKGTQPVLADWETHLTTLFPNLRLRDFLEIRHMDGQPFEHSFAPVAFFSALIQNKQVRADIWDLLKKHFADLKTLFDPTVQHDFSSLHTPLLDFACDVLQRSKEQEGLHAVTAYKKFLAEKESYWGDGSGLEFVQRHKTSSPSQDFNRYLS